ncbi:DNA primase/polymerase [Mycobacterium phage Nebkiss]|nr:DNA primase/polymerase [Mycobacterium phage Nebkiss]
MLIYTQCSSCKSSLMVSYVGQETCVDCPDSPSERQARAFVDAVQSGDEAEIQRTGKLLNQAPMPSLGSAALWYASIGWSVFPCVPGDKRPATRNGFKEATTDPERIKAWWSQADYNIGLPTGGINGFDVIDIDGPEGFRALIDVELPDTFGKVMTPRGAHLYVLPTGAGNRVGIYPSVDLRSDGGYVVAPPSRIDLKQYSWAIRPAPEIMGKADAQGS